MKNLRKQSLLTDILNRIAYYIEIAMSFVLLATVVVLLVELVASSGLFSFTGNHLEFTSFLSQAFNLIIGVELTKMLCRHTPETVVEVLLFATARQVIVSHSGSMEILTGVIAIAGLFAVKKFLLTGESGKQELVQGEVSGTLS